MALRNTVGRGWNRTAQRICMLVIAAAVVGGAGCEGILIPAGDTSLDGSWRITVFPMGTGATGTEICNVVISGGQPDKLTGIPGIPAQLASLGIGDIPLQGNSINLFGLLVVTGNGTLTINGSDLVLDISVTGSVTGQALDFSATLNGSVTTDGVIDGTARLNGALFGSSSFDDPNASIAFRMVRQ